MKDDKPLFYHVHSREGKIKAKKVGGDDKTWVTIKSPDDFFKHGHTVDIAEINHDFHFFKVLETNAFDYSHIETLCNVTIDTE